MHQIMKPKIYEAKIDETEGRSRQVMELKGKIRQLYSNGQRLQYPTFYNEQNEAEDE